MKNLLITLLLLTQIIFAQKKRPTFNNQGEVEDYHAVEFFEKDYKKQILHNFTGSIITSKDGRYTFDNKTLIVWGIPTELKTIFTKGILYPQLLIGSEENNPFKTEYEVRKLSDQERFNYIMSRNDTLKISDLEELKFLSKSHKIKRFRFWAYQQGFANPQVFFIELTNKNATRKMQLDEFIKGAKLTFIKGAWIII